MPLTVACKPESHALIGRFQVRKSYGPQALSKRQKNLFLSRNIHQNHIINILLASFGWSIRQVMDPLFFLPYFHGPRISHLGHKRKGKTRSITCRTDLTLG